MTASRSTATDHTHAGIEACFKPARGFTPSNDYSMSRISFLQKDNRAIAGV